MLYNLRRSVMVDELHILSLKLTLLDPIVFLGNVMVSPAYPCNGLSED